MSRVFGISMNSCLCGLVFGAAAFVSSAAGAQSSMAPLPLVPLPRSVQTIAGECRILAGAAVSYPKDDPGARFAAEHLAGLMKRTKGVALTPELAATGKGHIVLERTVDSKEGEGYELDVRPEGVTIRAATDAGLYYGTVTLWQLLEAAPLQTGGLNLHAVKIVDAPQMRWRGIMIDSARHMQSIEFLHQLVDWMSLEKLNTLHWHLTDDQAWRLEIKRYPRLTSVGGWRDLPSQEGQINPKTGKPYPKYGGYYTQAQVREFVAYAAKRNVMIVPEIEMPGHATAPIAAYPEFGSSTTAPAAAANHFGVFPNLYSPTANTFTFLQNVLTEVMELFPSPYIHVGGDEAIKNQWKSSPEIQSQMKSLGIANEDQLQSYFIKQVDTFLSAHGRRTLGWDEILDGGLAQNAAVMSWHGVKGGIEAAKQGHDAVLTPARPLYFNYRQTDAVAEAPGRFAMNTLADVYKFDPEPATLTAAQREHILGVQANVWTEYLITDNRVAWMIFPRSAALAEIGWTPAAQRDWGNFVERMPEELGRYKELGIPFDPLAFRPQSTETLVTDAPRRVEVALASQVSAGTLRYTENGGAVTASSPEYKAPLELQMPVRLRAAMFVGAAMVPGSEMDRELTQETVRRKYSQQMKQCVTDPVIAMEQDPAHGDRPVMVANYRNPCWIEHAALLDGVSSLTLEMVPLPWVFEDGAHKTPSLAPAKTAGGEVEVHLDSCKGQTIATLPLPQHPGKQGAVVLKAGLPAIQGAHDLCFQVARPQLDPLWTLNWAQTNVHSAK
ncbi:MAG: family 20 glycosylhydrolase [Acidobacteriaceae bacterium]|nr:family 20 glycosylhydrolase [Acidobacteriaceae bacterium]